MNLADYLERKRSDGARLPTRRDTCRDCRQPQACCYCAQVEPFVAPMRFAILPHPKEALNRTATGRLAHLCLEDSLWIPGWDFKGDPRIDGLLADPRYHSVLLYPGEDAVDLSKPGEAAHRALRPEGQRLLVFVIDGTWQTSRKTLRRSPNLRELPRVSFTPRAPSRFDIRRQPRPDCYSTCEAVYETIAHFGEERLTAQAGTLLRALDWMVQRELEFRSGVRSGSKPAYRPTRRPSAPEV